jgi:hypothetical protein
MRNHFPMESKKPMILNTHNMIKKKSIKGLSLPIYEKGTCSRGLNSIIGKPTRGSNGISPPRSCPWFSFSSCEPFVSTIVQKN